MDTKEIVSNIVENTETIDIFGELSDAIPYLKTTVKAYRWVQKKRITIFLKTLDIAVNELDEKTKTKFKKYISSETGYELLAEYSDRVLRTSSKISIAALAILYSDIECILYSDDFKYLACYSLHELSDEMVEVFLELMTLESVTVELTYKEDPKKVPYPVYFLNEESFTKNEKLKNLLQTSSKALLYINDFIRRGLFFTDHATNRFSGALWRCDFGVMEQSRIFESLLQSAKRYLK